MIPLRNLRRFFYATLRQPGYALSVLKKRVRGYFNYWIKSGRSSYPEAITLFLTHRCNLRCQMCGQWGERGVTKSESKGTIVQELNFEELKRLIDQISIFRPNITLFGGEPFLYKDIIRLIEYIKSKKIHCLVITNGSLLKSFAEDIVKTGLDELNLSLDGEERTHDGIRGMKGLFSRIIEGLNEVNFFKGKYKTEKPLINLQCTINKNNYLKLEELLNVAELIKANSLTYHHLIFLDKAIYEKQDNLMKEILPGTDSSKWQGFIFEPEINPEQLLKKINDIKKIKTSYFVNFYPNLLDHEIINYYQNPQYLSESYKPRCLSPWMVGYIFPDGAVRPCLNLSYEYGNIKEQEFGNIWNGEKAIQYRKILKDNQIYPACIRCTELFRY